MDKRSQRSQLVGTVNKVSGTDTISVTVEDLIPHELYQKVIRRSKKLLVHVDGDLPEVGQKVSIMQTRPISKRKRWRLVTAK